LPKYFEILLNILTNQNFWGALAPPGHTPLGGRRYAACSGGSKGGSLGQLPPKRLWRPSDKNAPLFGAY